jgi:hypothetical protein
MAMTADALSSRSQGWLRDTQFDLFLILGLTAFALLAGAAMTAEPALAGFVFFIDSWFLGFPHVAATISRLAPDKESLKRNRFLVFVLPVLVLAAISGITTVFGWALIATVYFYWQWYHTLRQSWGVAQLYRRQSSLPVRESAGAGEALFALVALWGLLHRMSMEPQYFLSPELPLLLVPVPVWFADGVGVVAVAGLLWWAYGRVREAMTGTLPLAHTLFCASHYIVFITGYIVLDDITGGWLVTNIWHTSQYLLLVWLFNEKAAAKGAAQGWFMRVTATNRPIAYFGLCMIIAVPVYFLIYQNFFLGAAGIMLALIANQTLNFHHFIVDAIIWRRRTAPAPAHV